MTLCSSSCDAISQQAADTTVSDRTLKSCDICFLLAAVIVAGVSLVLSCVHAQAFSLGQASFFGNFKVAGAIFASVFVFLNAKAWRVCLGYVFEQAGKRDKASRGRRVRIGLAVFAKISTLGILTAFLFLLPRSEFISFIIGFTATLLIGIVLVVLQTKKLG